jgi:hypothetical protein
MALVMTTLGEVMTAQLKLRPFKTAFFKAPDNGSPVKQSLPKRENPPGWEGSVVQSRTQKPKAKAALTDGLLRGGDVLYAHDVRGLEAFRSLGEVELDGLALIQAPVSALLDSRKMHKNILARGPLNETIALGSVKPLYCTFLSHNPLLSTTNLESPLLRGRFLAFPSTAATSRSHAGWQPGSRPERRLNVAGKQGLRLSFAVCVQRKKPHEFTRTEQDCSIDVDPWNSCNAVVQLLTETSTQIRVSVDPKAPPQPNPKGSKR